MLRTNIALAFTIALAGSCASAPAPKTAPNLATKPVVAAVAPAPDQAPPAPSHPKLGRGECDESFDCVDTVGFPPAGQRWTCVDGKCGHAKLPDLNGDSSSAAADASDENSKGNQTMKKARKRHN